MPIPGCYLCGELINDQFKQMGKSGHRTNPNSAQIARKLSIKQNQCDDFYIDNFKLDRTRLNIGDVVV